MADEGYYFTGSPHIHMREVISVGQLIKQKILTSVTKAREYSRTYALLHVHP